MSWGQAGTDEFIRTKANLGSLSGGSSPVVIGGCVVHNATSVVVVSSCLLVNQLLDPDASFRRSIRFTRMLDK